MNINILIFFLLELINWEQISPVSQQKKIRYNYSMFILNLIVLICFINIFGIIVSLYLISKYDIENNFPKFKRSIRYYEKSN